MHSATYDVERLVRWLNLCSAMVDMFTEDTRYPCFPGRIFCRIVGLFRRTTSTTSSAVNLLSIRTAQCSLVVPKFCNISSSSLDDFFSTEAVEAEGTWKSKADALATAQMTVDIQPMIVRALHMDMIHVHS